MSNSPKVRRFIVTSLVTASLALVACTAWQLWPVWQEHRHRMEFERRARLLHSTDTGAIEQLNELAGRTETPLNLSSDTAGNQTYLVPYYLRSYWYCVYLSVRPAPPGTPSDQMSRTVRVYRLEVPSDDYAAQTDGARQLVSRVGQVSVRNTPSGPVEEPALPLEGEPARRLGYVWDFYETITGRASGELGIRCELIHSDPS